MSSFDPSILDNKDREELSQIAEQLGKKPPARAKKADIVALILELAGVPAEGATDATGAEAPAEAPSPKPAGNGSSRGAPAAEVDAEAVGTGADDAAGEQAARVDEPPVETFRVQDNPRSAQASNGGREREARRPQPAANGGASADQANRDQGNRDQGNRSNQGGNGANSGQSNQPRPGRNQQGGGQPEGPNQATPSSGGGEPNGNQQAPSQGEEGDGGNRRRRRRGRGGQEQGGEDSFQGEPVSVEGLLDLRDEGYGFLRVRGYLPSTEDVYVSVKQVRQFALRKGDRLAGKSRPANRNEKNPALLQIDSVNGGDPEEMKLRVKFDDLTPLFPDERLQLEVANDPTNVTPRIIDLVAPIGKGQRMLIVSPPKAGKTSVMKQIARSIETNHPDVHLIVLLVDERPEEVTDMRRWLSAGEVAASTFDRPAEEHTHVAELVIERAKRMVEEGKDVVVMLDGITRLARAYNLAAPPNGRIMSGGIDTGALYPPKKFFGAARNVEEGGSLTILATALVDTGSRMDEVIFEEFKGTGNSELRLDRRMAERRIFPAIDVLASSTRREELLFDTKQAAQVLKLRRVLSSLSADEGSSAAAGLELLIDRMKSFKSNDAFLAEIGKAQA